MRRSAVGWLLVSLLVASVALGLAFWFDAAVLEWMRASQTRPLRSFMRSVSWWGDWYSHVVAGLLAAGIAHLLGHRRWRQIFIAMLVACALAGILNRAIKIGAGRARPSVQVDAGWNGPRLSSKYHAFPSGHTAASTAFFATLACASWRVGLLFLPIPLLIGFARMYVGAHHFSDVIAAAVLGVTVAFVVARWRVLAIENRESPIEN
ncbi:MAG: phosphatase PAP2 family protein [Chthoniobacterales bacterium]|nr:phosphatase PAP2 family protein [Chthoniobacterales bacterium]